MRIKAMDIAQMASPAEVIFGALRESIVEGSLAEGALLRQDQIARMFNVSRIPVREALTRLEEQGLVTTQRYRGAVVASLSFEEIEEIFEFRSLVEPEVIRHAVRNMQRESLTDAARAAEAFGSATDPGQWGDLNRDFHQALYRDCRRPYYLQVVDTSLDRIERYQRVQLTLTGGMERARIEHAGILAACVAGDADRAAELTRSHILGASLSLIDFLARTRADKHEA